MLTKRFMAFASLLCILLAAPAHATMVRKMDLAQLADAAGLIFRGTVVEAGKGTVSAGGGTIPTITYRIKVTEQLKGTFPAPSRGELFISITSVNHKAIEIPQLAVGQDYLLLTTRPSSKGLSTFVGLGQGMFKVYGAPNAEMAVNTVNNVGLASGLRGPAPYTNLADRIRTIVQQGSKQ